MEIKINCFISYAHSDNDLKVKFENHLSEFFKASDVAVWSDAKLVPGQNWYYTINQQLEESNIIFCLVSNHFIQSDPCKNELDRAMLRHRNGTSLVIPVILETTVPEPAQLPCSELQFCPVSDGRVKPISAWSTPSDGFRNACLQFKAAIDDMLKQLKNKDRSWRFREIQDMVSMNKITDSLKEMLSFSREFCTDNMVIQNKVCISMMQFQNLELQLKQNPGDIVGKVGDLLQVMNELYTQCGCK